MNRWSWLGVALGVAVVPMATEAKEAPPLQVWDASRQVEAVASPEAGLSEGEVLQVAAGRSGRSSGSVERAVRSERPSSPPPAPAPRVKVDVQVSPGVRFAPAPPPSRSLNGAQRSAAPPPPHAPPPPSPGSTVRSAPQPPPPGGTYAPPRPPPPGPPRVYSSGPRYYVYPRVYTTGIWSWWWWTPPGYHYHYHHDHHHHQEAPAPQAKREAPPALHVGDHSLGIWAGVQQGAYADGTFYSDPGLRFSLRYRSTPHLGLDVTGGFYGTRLYPEGEQNDHRADVPLQLSATFHAFPRSPVQVYALVGLTADYRDFQKVGFYDGYGMGYEQARFQDLRLGPHVGLGMEIMIGPELSLHGDIRSTTYTFAPQASLEQTQPFNFSSNLGISFFF